MNVKDIEKYYDIVNKIIKEEVLLQEERNFDNIVNEVKSKYLNLPTTLNFKFFEGRLKMYIEELAALFNINYYEKIPENEKRNFYYLYIRTKIDYILNI